MKKVDFAAVVREIPDMDTITVDSYKRVRIPDARPGQVFAFTNNGDGTRTLTEIRTVEVKVPKSRLVKNADGVLVLVNDRKPSLEEIQKALEEFP